MRNGTPPRPKDPISVADSTSKGNLFQDSSSAAPAVLPRRARDVTQEFLPKERCQRYPSRGARPKLYRAYFECRATWRGVTGAVLFCQEFLGQVTRDVTKNSHAATTPPPSSLTALLDARNMPDIPSISRLVRNDANGVFTTREFLITSLAADDALGAKRGAGEFPRDHVDPIGIGCERGFVVSEAEAIHGGEIDCGCSDLSHLSAGQ